MSPISRDDLRKLTILVVDDEKLVADSLVQILNLFGFQCHLRILRLSRD